MDISSDAYRRTYTVWLRTGRWTVEPVDDDIERKFNPYHDPRNGQFTFAPGGPHSLSQVIVSHGRRSASGSKPLLQNETGEQNTSGGTSVLDAVYRPDETQVGPVPASFPRVPRSMGRSNAQAFHDPMTLQQAIPTLESRPAGAIVALADNLFDITGPAQEMTTQLARERSNQLIEQIRAIDPDYRFESLGFPYTPEGQFNQINDLRFARAVTFLRARNEIRPLQLETLRLLQQRVDNAYSEGVKLLREGKLKVRLSNAEALGNFIDRRVRFDLRKNFSRFGIDAAGKGPVRVNRRENNSSAGETSFRLPDARVGDIAYDVTLTQKTLKTGQIGGFFEADFRPTHVIIIRPRQVGSDSTYLIVRPETK